jgi:hypothetical protein
MSMSATAPSVVQIDRRHLLGYALLVAVIVAGLTWALVALVIDRSDAPSAPATPATSEQVLAALDPSARQFVQGVTSQSPAALAAAYGRSPVSSAPTAAASSRAADARELAEIAAWANSQGLVGQSPASLHPVP